MKKIYKIKISLGYHRLLTIDDSHIPEYRSQFFDKEFLLSREKQK